MNTNNLILFGALNVARVRATKRGYLEESMKWIQPDS